MATPLPFAPHGYPGIGLAARTLPLRPRADANLRRLAGRLEDWEAARGNPSFSARNLHRLPRPLAFEFAHLYVALRERYPAVRADFIDFRVDLGSQVLAAAYRYPEVYPTTRALLAAGWVDVAAVGGLDPVTAAAAARDCFGERAKVLAARLEVLRAEASGSTDLLATGAIEVGTAFAGARSYRRLIERWAERNRRAVTRGNSPRIAEVAVSPAAATFLHEFGHLVEAELHQRGRRQVERVYGALSTALLGVKRPDPSQWRYHLVNYPAYPEAPHPGHPGGPARRRATRAALRPELRAQLGAYATTWRDELFAEAFTYALAGATHRQRCRFEPFLAALAAAGLTRR